MTALLLELSDDLYEPLKQQALSRHKNPEQIVIELLRQLFEKPKTDLQQTSEGVFKLLTELSDDFMADGRVQLPLQEREAF
jgi:hypothetical protein